jgi:hypothetical protein
MKSPSANKRDGADRINLAVRVKFFGSQSMVACSSYLIAAREWNC